MSVTYGYFDSVNGDRTYNADQMSEYFDGLVSDGVYESVGEGLRVEYATGMAVTVKRGRALIECKWLKNSGDITLTITAAHVTLPRYTAVVVKLDKNNRTMSVTTIDGTPSSQPALVGMINTGGVKTICLAQVYVPAGATVLNQSYITDMRASSQCGWVTGVVKQVDTSRLFLQWESAYADFYNRFQSWFDTLTSELTVGAYVKRYNKIVHGGLYTSQIIPIFVQGYTYESTDIIDVFVNGLKLLKNEINFDETNQTITVPCNMVDSNNVVEIVITKSVLGNPGGARGSFIPISADALEMISDEIE